MIAVLLAVTGCDFSVSNPGPVHDENLDEAGAHDALVRGGMREVVGGLGGWNLLGGAVVKDFTPGGHTGYAGIQEPTELGLLGDEARDYGYYGWQRVHRGRWILEHATTRLAEAAGEAADAYEPLARAYLWAGFANRILGEHVCTAVFDGGGPEPYTNHFTRALDHFSDAERIAAAAGAEELELAAIAGQAQAHVFLNQWDEAEAAASRVPFDFSFQFRYTGRNTAEHSWLIEAATTSFRSITFWNTAFEDYFPETGDPRVAWGHDEDEPADVPRPTFGRKVPMYYPLKTYAPRNKSEELATFAPVSQAQHQIPHDMADGREMVLIRAEAQLVRGNWPEATRLINDVRTTAFDPGTGESGSYFTGEPLDPVTTSGLEDAWAALKFERLIELNLEARRFGDRKRWRENDTPGELHPDEYVPDALVEKYGVSKEPRNLCQPVPRAEKEVNPNIPLDYEDPRVGQG